jgi:hypothetical protein
MEIVSARLEAVNSSARPQILSITTRPGDPCIIGRHDFFTGADSIISRRHAKFQISTTGVEQLQVINLSKINGILVNLVPLPLNQCTTLYDADEIVRPRFAVLM